MKKEDFWLFMIWKLFGFLIFLFVIFVFNVAAKFVRDPLFFEIVKLVNQNIITILLISIFFIMGEVLVSSKKPYKYFGPIFNGLSALFVAYFIVEVIIFLGRLIEGSFFELVEKNNLFIYFVFFFVVTLISYVGLFISKRKRPVKNKKT